MMGGVVIRARDSATSTHSVCSGTLVATLPSFYGPVTNAGWDYIFGMNVLADSLVVTGPPIVGGGACAISPWNGEAPWLPRPLASVYADSRVQISRCVAVSSTYYVTGVRVSQLPKRPPRLFPRSRGIRFRRHTVGAAHCSPRISRECPGVVHLKTATMVGSRRKDSLAPAWPATVHN